MNADMYDMLMAQSPVPHTAPTEDDDVAVLSLYTLFFSSISFKKVWYFFRRSGTSLEGLVLL